MLTTYEPEIFDGLNHFQVARQNLENYREVLKEAGKLICNHKLQHIVGLTLLHKHFDLSAHERLVERIEGDDIYIDPVNETDDAATIPYLWKLGFDKLMKIPSWFPLEFQHRLSAGHDAVKAIESLTANHEFLEEIAVKFQDCGVEDIFGLSILHRDIPLKEGEILVETTDCENRSLMITALSQDEIQHEDLTETLWYFTADERVGVAGDCIMHCSSHCRGHY